MIRTYDLDEDRLPLRLSMSPPFAVGLLTGFFWLLPVFGPPSMDVFADGISPLRVIRLLLPLTLWMLVERKQVRWLLNSVIARFPAGRFAVLPLRLVLLSFALVFFPVLAGIISGNLSFVISAVAPQLLSLVVLAAIVVLDERSLHEWVLGIGFASLLFLTLGIVSSGLRADGFFGRPRVLMGFTHPLITASAVLSVMLFLALYGRERLSKKLHIPLRMLTPTYVLISLFLLEISQSRNLLLSCLVGVFLCAAARRISIVARVSLLLLLLIGPVVFYAFVLLSPPTNPLWAWLNDQASYRLEFYQKLMLGLIKAGGSAIAPNASRLDAISNQLGFAAVDSVFLSYLVNYGIGSLSLLVLLFGAVGWQLARSRQNAVAFGAFCGLIVFYCLDAQGFTTSNLIVFIIFGYVVRCALRFAVRTDRTANTSREPIEQLSGR